MSVLRRVIEKEGFTVEEDALSAIALLANGDARTALNVLELAVEATADHGAVTKQLVQEASQKTLLYDKGGEEHYNIISALQKSLAIPTWMPRCTGWLECSSRVKFRFMSLGGWCDLLRRHRCRRPASVKGRARCQAGIRVHRSARGQARTCAMRDLSGRGAEVEFGLRGVFRGRG